MQLYDAFPDTDHALCDTFFAPVGSDDSTPAAASAATWADMKRLAYADDNTFWTVLTRHRRLHSILASCVSAVETAHSSASAAPRRALRDHAETSLLTVLVRMSTMLEFCITTAGRIDLVALAARFNALVPVRVLFAASPMLYRAGSTLSAVVISSLFVLNPGSLYKLHSYLAEWCDTIDRLAVRCVDELQRGRFQRLAGDVTGLFEQTYRCVRQLWCVLQSAPFVADYTPLAALLRGLRVVVDVVTPLLQHFVLVGEALAPQRALLSRAASAILNSALNASVVLMLFRTFERRAGAGEPTWVVPALVERGYGLLQQQMRQYTTGYVHTVLSQWRGGHIDDLVHHLTPPMHHPAEDRRLGHILRGLGQEMTDRTDFAPALVGIRARYFDLLLAELVRQGVHVNTLLRDGLLDRAEATELGASEESMLPFPGRPNAGSDATDGGTRRRGTTAPAAATPPTAADVDPERLDPAAAMVRDVFPEFALPGIHAAMALYHNDVEQFILDASMDNVPPHLVPLLSAHVTPNRPAATGGDASAEQTHTREEGVAGSARRHESLLERMTDAGVSRFLTGTDYEEDADTEAEGEGNVAATAQAGGGSVFLRCLGRDIYDLLVTDDAARETETETEERRGMEGNDAEMSADTPGGDLVKYTTLHSAGGNAAASRGFDVEEGLKEKIRMLNEQMYEDEDDENERSAVYLGDADETEREESGDGGDGTEASAPAPVERVAAPPPRDVYHDKQFHARRAAERTVRAAEARRRRPDAGGSGEGGGATQSARGQPAYAKKRKTLKVMHRRGMDTTAAARH